MSNTNLTIGIAVAILIAIVGVFLPQAGVTKLFGATSCSSITCLSGGLRLVSDAGGDFETDVAAVFNSTFKLGASGTAQANQVVTTCSPIANVSIAATSSGYAFCTGVTGVTSADTVIAQFGTTTQSGFNQNKDNFYVISASASTTAGAVDLRIWNGTGATLVPSAAGQAASTTVIRAGH